ncbi:thiamine-monophosphate kinase [gamma proteobacterium HTCC5015]|nr:thiamine-monophosphate kinase [gamma proteobacterium HTCC5015]
MSATGAPRSDVQLGPGDDAAILQAPAGYRLATSSDTLIAGRHFPENTVPEAVGHKALAVNLSDLAAMGAKPAWVSLALTLPEASEVWLRGFASGFGALAAEYGVALIGGDTTRGPLSVTLTVTGFLPESQALLRSGAQIGESVYVSGRLGAAAQELGQVLQGGSLSPDQRRHLDYPQPRVELGQQLLPVASSAMDLSDGLLSDAAHLAAASELAVDIDLSRLPLAESLASLPREEAWALASAGDDYELLFTAPNVESPRLEALSQTLGLPLTRVGRTREGDGVHCFERDGVPFEGRLQGYDHFLR